ncbi:MAG: replication initiation protein, partial [Desulforhopalus sp.]
YCLAHYDSRGNVNNHISARISNLTDVFPMDQKSAYAVVRKVMISLGKKPLEVQIGNRRKYRNWFSGFDYVEGAGEFEFMINPDVQPFLLQLGGEFTRYRLGAVYQFKAASTWKLYELLKRWLEKKSWLVELDELRLLLGVAGKYTRWDSLKRQIDKAIKEINETSDIHVKYENKTRSRSVIGLTFFINKTKPGDKDVIDIKSDRNKLHSALLEIGVSTQTAQKYTNAIEAADKVEIILNKLPLMLKRKKGESAQKYVLGAIKAELSQHSLFSDQEAQTKAYQEAVRCHNDREQECKRRTNTKVVCDICDQIFKTK